MCGGGGGSSGPTSTTVNNSNLPAYLQPAVEQNVQAAQAATSSPYNINTAQQVAAFTPAQIAAQQGVMGLQAPNQQYGQALGTTGNVINSSWTNPGVAQSFMNPYQQGVTDIANQELARQSNIQGTYDDARFAKAGAFGGSRQGIVDAERNRNLAILQNQNQITGANTAYNTGMQQYNTQLQNQLAGAAQMGNLATAQQNANLGVLNAQLGVGGSQQQQQQAQLTAAAQNALNQQNWALNQAQAMSGILHGTPNAMSTTMTNVTAPPNIGAQVAGLGIAGLGAYGASQAGGTA